MNIIKLIEKARGELVELGMKKGFQHPQVIKKSQMLDELINQYYRLAQRSTRVKAVS
ncbi:MAG: Spo0E family sporulation regulatory protein-aspartic acid phosphatase [Firmicutes bacterium HGW-Firmicutes-15]|nr:MAG: Spo0E family sporulation regulatory protein-aspartic acid phosphatase [Firmicutes bacterium HGW-Firmicutes-15]